jgi:signal transduction histidine kinase
MKVAAAGVPDSIRATLRSWGWQLTEENPDAILTECGHHLEIRTGPALYADDVIFLPLREEELKQRIKMAQRRRLRLAKRLHDFRSSLNAIQGYAEIIAETAHGDSVRFVSNIRTASELLTSRLETLRDEGV